ncbi:MFS transporter [Methylocella silvestris]|uniref:MFS transporter n=1 Tax=Methylocella silvestris TaxID=199596 RepID=A0A2J7TIR0_METSI|nr:MFS transporter [Methylocella silvestris]PNG26661.1 MFS transporter [Methylocella silvestris]
MSVVEVSPAAAPQTEAGSLRPFIGILGVLLGSMMSTLGSRITTFGLADLRGGLHAGFDEGAWITTSFGVGQMASGVASAYLASIFGVRRFLLYGVTLFFTTSLLAPFSPNLTAYFVTQFLGGLGSGTFIPLTISFIVRSLPQRLIIYGVAVYAMNSELSQNIGASLEGWYAENWSWAFIHWQYCIALPLMFVCVFYGVPRDPPTSLRLRDLDWPGLVYGASGFALLYAGLDQGNRLDWTNNGLVNGLLISGALFSCLFIVREYVAERPFINLRVIARESLAPLILLLAGYRFIILSTAYIIPSYLQTVQNFRELQVGSVLLWIALPQFVIVAPLAALLTRVDPRLVLGLGTGFIGVACLMATGLTSQWATQDFLPSQVLQAMGQSFALTALLVLIVRSIKPADALTIGSLMQITRLLGGEIGTAFMQTFVRIREQVHSNLVGLHVESFSAQTAARLDAYRSILAGSSSEAEAAARAAKLLGQHVAQQAAVLSYIDGFLAAAFGSFLCLLVVAMVRYRPPSLC